MQRLYSNLIPNYSYLYEIPEQDFCLAINDFKSQLKYGGSPKKYYIVEATQKHEERHRDDYLEMLDQLKDEFDLPNKLVEYKPDCDEIDNYNEALRKGAEKIRHKLKQFLKYFKVRWIKKIGKKGRPERDDYEQYTQDRINDVIHEYIKQLEAIYPHLDKDNC